ncbi:hypothetical protein OHT59_40565 [Streptomyces sp. NBC_00243]|uniref:hypothetical protein n=1 Tax=Streptomyces sp. NBC_00243 TaxID=2975688 RepID=UPI002DD99994|nr:hypothetical protein [Streptomyces sp. NBC_00243]WRZ24367.1 hypothetical protein OHT59_40565 [Streptomyces sp. NBC_00243]
MPMSRIPGRDPLPDARLDSIRATLAAAPEGEHQALRDVLGELDRIRPLLRTTLDANGVLLDNWARLEGVAPHPFLGLFCRTCRAEVKPGTEGCPRHSPTAIGRALYRMHADNRSLLDGEDAGRRAVAMLDAVLPLLAAVLNPVDHKPECRERDCRCGCDRRQNCQDCYRCVCWRSECCAEKAIRWHAEQAWEGLTAEAGVGSQADECPVCKDEGCKSRRAAPGAYCALCRFPHAEHQFVECDTFTA